MLSADLQVSQLEMQVRGAWAMESLFYTLISKQGLHTHISTQKEIFQKAQHEMKYSQLKDKIHIEK